MEEIYDVLPTNTGENENVQDLDHSDYTHNETYTRQDDTDELAELFGYFNYSIFLLENDIYLPIILRTGNGCHQYENVYIVYTEKPRRESINNTTTTFHNLPHYENMDVHEFRRNRTSYNSDDYESIYVYPLKKNFLQKIIDFFRCTHGKLEYKPPLSKTVFSNGDVFYKYTEDHREAPTVRNPDERYKNLNQNETIYENIDSYLALPVHSLPNRQMQQSRGESIYENISDIEFPIYPQSRPLPTPPLPDRKFFSSETDEPIYEEIDFHISDESLYAIHGVSSNEVHRQRPESQYMWAEANTHKNAREVFHLIWTIVCTGMYIMDVGSDMLLAFRYWSNGENLYCGLTLSLVYIASTVDLIYSIYREEFIGKKCIYKFRLIIMFLLNVRGIFEYFYLLRLEYKNLQTRFVKKALKRNLQLQKARIATLNFYEGIFEACPQIVLQLYLILMVLDKDLKTIVVFQAFSVISSLCASGTAFVNMEKGVRLEDYGIHDLSLIGIIVQYLWLSPITASRLLSVALLLIVAPQWLLLGATLHMSLGVALYWYRNEAPTSPRKAVNACVYGARVLVSPYEPAYVRHIVPVLNAVHSLQNAAATTAWAWTTAPSAPTALVAAVCAINLATHALGLLFAVLFHKCKRRFYTFHNVTIVDYGYAVVQIV